MDSGRVVILGHENDPHLPYVTRFLDEEPLVINTGDIPTESLDIETVPGFEWPKVFYKGELVGPVRSVWYRSVDINRLLTPEGLARRISETLEQPHELEAHWRLFDDITGDPGSEYCAHEMDAEPFLQEYMASSLNRLAAALSDVLPAVFWISRREALIHADSKPRQMRLAAKLGFDLPATLFASSPDRAMVFLAKHGRCVIKPLAIRPPSGYNQYTTVLEHGKVGSFHGLNVNPHIMQELIEPDYELRVVVAGRKVLVRDTNETEARMLGVRDWRYGCEADTFAAEPYSLPDDVAERCLAFTHESGIVGGKFDFAVKNGKYNFLECNANGQWAFVDEWTVEQVGREIAERPRQIQ